MLSLDEMYDTADFLRDAHITEEAYLTQTLADRFENQNPMFNRLLFIRIVRGE